MKFIAGLWGAIGVATLLIKAIVGLIPKAHEALTMHLQPLHWVIMVVFAIFMLFVEGYRGFQKRLCPRVAARVQYLTQNPTPLRVILAPFFCMGYFYANKRTKIVSISVSLGVFALVKLMPLVPQPWRGIFDIGVILGLSYGVLCFGYFLIKVFTQKDHGISAQTPGT